MFTYAEKEQAERDYDICMYYSYKYGVSEHIVNNPCKKCAAAVECPLAFLFRTVEGEKVYV
jgi:hypothetical protein